MLGGQGTSRCMSKRTKRSDLSSASGLGATLWLSSGTLSQDDEESVRVRL